MLDKQYRKILLSNILERYRYNMISNLIIRDMAHGGYLSVIYWNKSRNVFGLSKKDIFLFSLKAYLSKIKRIISRQNN